MSIELRDLIGKPFRLHGRGPDAYDCYGLAIEVLRRYGKTLPDAYYQDASRENNALVIADYIATHCMPLVDSWREGDLIVIRVAGKPSHIGVYIGDGMYIHSSRSSGVKIESVTSIRSKVEGCYRWEQ